MKKLSILNFCLLIVILGYGFFQRDAQSRPEVFEELTAQRLNIVGADGNPYIVISNPERQAKATQHGEVIQPDKGPRDLPGLIFFNRVGDEVGGIYYDGTDEESFAGITFDQQKNDQIMAIMKDEYLDGETWKRWYGMFFRERKDGIRVETLFAEFEKRTAGLSQEEKQKEYLAFKRHLDAEVNIYRMFLGREENGDVGLFLFDGKGRPRIQLFIDGDDNARILVKDEQGNARDLVPITP